MNEFLAFPLYNTLYKDWISYFFLTFDNFFFLGIDTHPDWQDSEIYNNSYRCFHKSKISAKAQMWSF